MPTCLYTAEACPASPRRFSPCGPPGPKKITARTRSLFFFCLGDGRGAHSRLPTGRAEPFSCCGFSGGKARSGVGRRARRYSSLHGADLVNIVGGPPNVQAPRIAGAPQPANPDGEERRPFLENGRSRRKAPSGRTTPARGDGLVSPPPWETMMIARRFRDPNEAQNGRHQPTQPSIPQTVFDKRYRPTGLAAREPADLFPAVCNIPPRLSSEGGSPEQENSAGFGARNMPFRSRNINRKGPGVGLPGSSDGMASVRTRLQT